MELSWWRLAIDGAILLLLLVWFVMDRCHIYFLSEGDSEDTPHLLT